MGRGGRVEGSVSTEKVSKGRDGRMCEGVGRRSPLTHSNQLVILICQPPSHDREISACPNHLLSYSQSQRA